MHNWRALMAKLVLLLIVSVLLPVTPALADDSLPDDGIVIWNEDYTLGEGETLEGDLVVFNGDVTLKPGSRVRGDTVIWNGEAVVEGVIEGALVVSGGDILLGGDARVDEDVVCTWNCDIDQEEGARVGGQIIEALPLRDVPFEDWGEWMEVPGRISQPRFPWESGLERVLRWILKMIRRVVTVLVIAVMGGLVALIWPDPTEQVGNTTVEYPGASLGFGLLTTIAVTALIVALAITICFSPIAMLVALALGAAGLFGWIAVGAVVGERMLKMLDAGEIAPPWSAGLGTLVISLISMGLSIAFCLAPLGWLLTLALGWLGLGAVVLTRFGTTSYTPAPRERPASPAPAALPAETTEEAEDIDDEQPEDV